MVELPEVVIMLYWFDIQFFSGAASIGAEGGGEAWWAHVGGFVLGFALVKRFGGRHRRSTIRYRIVD